MQSNFLVAINSENSAGADITEKCLVLFVFFLVITTCKKNESKATIKSQFDLASGNKIIWEKAA